MIFLQLGGGLGNQMFQYAMARSLQLETQEKLRFYMGNLNNDNLRNYGLNNLKINNKIKICSLVQNVIFKLIVHYAKYKVNKRKNMSLADSYFDEGIYYSIGETLYNFPFYSRKNTKQLKLIIGGFQSYRCFKKYELIIKKELKVSKEPSIQNQRMYKAIDRSNSVCVHIRLGDYSNYKELDICTEKYYMEAMEYIFNNTEKPIFYIFSYDKESLQWIKENFNFPSKFVIKYVNLENPDYEELRLMYTCKHFVISNSTFSWWAQFLSENEKKMVVAPSVWNRKIDANDIYQEKWKLIEV